PARGSKVKASALVNAGEDRASYLAFSMGLYRTAVSWRSAAWTQAETGGRVSEDDAVPVACAGGADDCALLSVAIGMAPPRCTSRFLRRSSLGGPDALAGEFG
ncbi:MAG: hypothetical protein D6695_00160, partial [Planctomycetota bacterium]